jgi:hypothetical protein
MTSFATDLLITYLVAPRVKRAAHVNCVRIHRQHDQSCLRAALTCQTRPFRANEQWHRVVHKDDIRRVFQGVSLDYEPKKTGPVGR